MKQVIVDNNSELELGAVRELSDSYSKHFDKNFNVDGSPSNTDLEAIFNNPQDNISNIIAYSKYCYRKHGIIMRVINIIRDFGATGLVLDYPKKGNQVKDVIAEYNKRVNIGQLIKDIIFELALTGNVVCYDRDGMRVDIYPIDMIKIVPLIRNNKQVLAYKVNKDNDVATESYGKTTDGIDVDKKLETALPDEVLKAKKFGNGQYAILDSEKSYFSKINASQYEPYGVSVILPAFEDLSHKSLLKEAEKSTANDIINKTFHVSIGDKDNKPSRKLLEDYNNLFAGKTGSVLATTPYYVNLEWIEPKTDIFGEDKFVEIDTDILNTLGVSLTLIRGEGGGNYAEGMLNFSGLTRTIEGIRGNIPSILEGLYKSELIRNNLNPDHCPSVRFEDVVIDSETKTNLLLQLFQNAGLPYQALYEGCDMNYDAIKLMREDENSNDMDETFKLHSMPFQGGQNGDMQGDNGQPNGQGGAPKKQLSDRKSDKTASNNNSPRTGLNNTNRNGK
ncbi:MAG: hypothetical protein M0P10_06505 [Sphaerochaetaceae bacterium]|nr:hypothetical protein [Sphaerochaetaceae bacterium]